MTDRPLRKDAERNRLRILAAARELFAERGLGVTLNDVAHHARVGVGTVYRRFPDREQLIEALFEERLQEIVGLLEAARADPDPWLALTRFHEQTLELQAADRGLKDLMLGAPGAPERLEKLRAQVRPLATELVERARASGCLRPDCEPEDFAAVHLMLSAVIDAGHDLAPDLWRRYYAVLLRGLETDAKPPEPLPTPSVSPGQMEELLMDAWPRRRV